MSEEGKFTITLEPTNDYEFVVRFDWDGVTDLVLDEPEPLGHERGPNAARILAAAVGNCLTASLLFCLRKSRAEPHGMKTTVEGTLARNERGRQRIGGMRVRIDLDEPEDQAARVRRCLGLFEDYCVITESVRKGFPVDVQVFGTDGRELTAQAPTTES
jgi:uncharacterized OsmC-like protein